MADGSAPTERKRTKLSSGAIARYYAGAGTADAGSSLYGTMCDRLALMTHRSVRCKLCAKTPGVRELTPEELAKRAARLAEIRQKIARSEAEKPEFLSDERARQNELERLQDQKRALLEQLGEETTCKRCSGTGYVTPSRSHRSAVVKADMFMTQRCTRCRGCGEPLGEVTKVEKNARVYYFAALAPNDATAEREDRCLKCHGEAFTVPITAKETGSSKGGKAPTGGGSSTRSDAGGVAYAETEVAATWVDEDALAERGRVSRALDELRRVDPVVARAIEALHGPEGDKWGGHRWGRGFVLWQFATAGIVLAKEAAERSRRGHGHLVPPLELIATERETEFRATRPDHRRRALIAQADRQARALHARVQAALRGGEAA